MDVVRIFVYHAAKSDQLLRKIHRALVTRLQREVVFINKPEAVDMVFGVYMSDDGRHRVLRKLGERK